jgi:hypothetical protein
LKQLYELNRSSCPYHLLSRFTRACLDIHLYGYLLHATAN